MSITYRNFIGLLSFLIFAFFINFSSNNYSYFNYDSVPYAASAYILKNKDKDESHSYAWGLLEDKAPEFVFNDLCCATEYRISMYKNQESFIAQLPSYQTKSLYIYFIRMTSDALKVDEYDAMRLITIFSIYLTLFFVYLIFLREKTGFLIASLPLMILYQLPSLGRLLTPDSLIFLFFTAATFFILNKKYYLAALILIASILLRQTNLIYVGLLSTFFILRKEYWVCALISFSAVSLYLTNSIIYESLGYVKTFNYGLIKIPTDFVNYSPSLTFETYLQTLKGKFMWMLMNENLNRFIALFFLQFLLVITLFISSQSDRIREILFWSLCFSLSVFLSYILIPFPDQRLYAAGLFSSAIFMLKAFCLVYKN